MSVRKLSFFLFFLALAGCKMGPDYRRPEMELPEKWQNILARSEGEKENVEWWRHFEDETLIKLIDLVLEQNFDLKAAESAILQNQEIFYLTPEYYRCQTNLQNFSILNLDK